MSRAERRRRTRRIIRRRAERWDAIYGLDLLYVPVPALAKNNVPPAFGRDYWSRRCRGMHEMVPGRFSKKLTHRWERQDAQRIERLAG